jgi:hypothetical protein
MFIVSPSNHRLYQQLNGIATKGYYFMMILAPAAGREEKTPHSAQ